MTKTGLSDLNAKSSSEAADWSNLGNNVGSRPELHVKSLSLDISCLSLHFYQALSGSYRAKNQLSALQQVNANKNKQKQTKTNQNNARMNSGRVSEHSVSQTLLGVKNPCRNHKILCFMVSLGNLYIYFTCYDISIHVM